jgi:hypothetical protein
VNLGFSESKIRDFASNFFFGLLAESLIFGERQKTKALA